MELTLKRLRLVIVVITLNRYSLSLRRSAQIVHRESAKQCMHVLFVTEKDCRQMEMGISAGEELLSPWHVF